MYNKKIAKNFKKVMLSVAILLNFSAQAQEDENSLMKEFNKVMSFATQKNLYYKSITKAQADPVLSETDSMSFESSFYKKGTDIYSKNPIEEMLLKDSFLIQINHSRKAILIKKIDIVSKQKVNELPTMQKQLIEYLKTGYNISKEKVSNSISKLVVVSKPKEQTPLSNMQVTLHLEYDNTTLYPSLLKMDIEMKEPVTDYLLSALKVSGVNAEKAIKNIDGKDYFVRKQQLVISFYSYNELNENSYEIPTISSKLLYLKAMDEYIGVDELKEYKVTKTF